MLRCISYKHNSSLIMQFSFPYGLAVCQPSWVYLFDLFYSGIQFYLLLSPYLCFISVLYLDLYALGDDALISKGVFHANQISKCLDPHLN